VRKFTVLIVVTFLLSLTAFAADYPQAEVFGGFQYSHLQLANGLNAPGYNVAFTGNFNRWFGVTADLGAGYTNINAINVSNYTYTFGPVFSFRAHRRVTPFAHVLFGGEHASASLRQFGESINGFAVIAGGGVDANMNRRFAIRVAQADWMLFHGNGGNSDRNVRISTGIVVKF